MNPPTSNGAQARAPRLGARAWTPGSGALGPEVGALAPGPRAPGELGSRPKGTTPKKTATPSLSSPAEETTPFLGGGPAQQLPFNAARLLAAPCQSVSCLRFFQLSKALPVLMCKHHVSTAVSGPGGFGNKMSTQKLQSFLCFL